jgi:hypothetical protein
MKQIDVSTQKHPDAITMVDDSDFKSLMDCKCRWSASNYSRNSKTIYVTARIDGKRVPMHRVILNAPDGMEVDHIDGNGLNNQRSNLRLVTTQQNSWNRGIKSTNKSGYKGVCFRKASNMWRSSIWLNGKYISLGSFFCLIKAAKAYDTAAIKYFGEFARLNFPE